MTLRIRGSRAGFTLVEMAVVILILGVLSGLALPELRTAVAEADAAKVLTDVANIRRASHAHRIEEGTFPGSGRWGEVPAEMATRLPEGFAFEYKGLRYRWFSFRFPIEIFGSNELGILMVDLRPRPPIARALRSAGGDFAVWSPSMMWFLFTG